MGLAFKLVTGPNFPIPGDSETKYIKIDKQ